MVSKGIGKRTWYALFRIVVFLTFFQVVFYPSLGENQAGEDPTLNSQADRIYHGGTIYTMEDGNTAEAVAIKNDTIIFVGSDEDAMKLKRNNTGMVDLNGDVMLPGFVEPHIHHALTVAFSCLKNIRADEAWGDATRDTISSVMDRDTYLREMIKAEQELTNPEDWLIVTGYAKYYHGDFNKTDLENISATRPIILLDRSFHVATLNDKALSLLNFTEENTRDDPNINFTWGKFYESATIQKILPAVAQIELNGDKWREGLKQDVQIMHGNGITTCADMYGFDGLLPGQNITFREIMDSPDVPFRTYMVTEPRLYYEKGGEAATLRYMESLPEKSGHNLIYKKQAKLFVDGAFFAQNMIFRDGYTDGHQGLWMTPPEELKNLTSLFWKGGYPMHFHVQADGALDVLLSELETLQKTDPNPNITITLHHVGYARPDQIQKIKDLKIMVSLLPYYLRELGDIYSTYGLGPERATNLTPAGKFARENVTFSLHSDNPMAPADPLFSAWAAVNREGVLSGEVLGPDQRITVDQALRAITIDAARTIGADDITGSIQEGKKADFVILEEDPYLVDPLRLKDIRIRGTVFNGRYFGIDAEN